MVHVKMMNEKIHFITESTGWHSEEPLELLNIIVFVFVIIINSLHWNSILHPKKKDIHHIFIYFFLHWNRYFSFTGRFTCPLFLWCHRRNRTKWQWWEFLQWKRGWVYWISDWKFNWSWCRSRKNWSYLPV